ncbi:hypothetical protein EMIT0P4_230031 [Pseudomonas sp. IT-P4]
MSGAVTVLLVTSTLLTRKDLALTVGDESDLLRLSVDNPHPQAREQIYSRLADCLQRVDCG